MTGAEGGFHNIGAIWASLNVDGKKSGKKRRGVNRKSITSEKARRRELVGASATVLRGKEEKLVVPASQCVGEATGSRGTSLGGSTFSLKLVWR